MCVHSGNLTRMLKWGQGHMLRDTYDRKVGRAGLVANQEDGRKRKLKVPECLIKYINSELCGIFSLSTMLAPWPNKQLLKTSKLL